MGKWRRCDIIVVIEIYLKSNIVVAPFSPPLTQIKIFMKAIILIFVLALGACGQSSSPEGRMTIKIEGIQKELDSLKKQNALILDSMGKINEELRKMNR